MKYILYRSFGDLDKDIKKHELVANVIDTTNQTVPETIESIKAHLKSGQNRIK